MNRLDFKFYGMSESGKTGIYLVYSGQQCLGQVRYWAHWRKYVFMPDAGTVYDASCLDEVGAFCTKITTEQRTKPE